VPSSGMPMPLDIEAIAANPVQADEGTIELLTKVLGEEFGSEHVAREMAAADCSPL
jgi:hypothetical protein